jgi:hypothetical protein
MLEGAGRELARLLLTEERAEEAILAPKIGEEARKQADSRCDIWRFRSSGSCFVDPGNGKWGEAGSRVKDGRAAVGFAMLSRSVERVFTVVLESVCVYVKSEE